MNVLRVAAQRSFTQTRALSTRPALRNATATALPISEAVRTVAERAQSAVAQQASVEGFKAGVVYTLLAGSVATGAILCLSPDGNKEIKSGDLL